MTKWFVVATVLAMALGLLGCAIVPPPADPKAADVRATSLPENTAVSGQSTPDVARQATPLAPAQTKETVIILHTNDFHGAIESQVSGEGGTEHGGLVNLVSLIDQLRAQDPEHTLLLDAGDSFQGTYVSNSTLGATVMAAMNIAGYDAWALGNHEFDWGQVVVKERIQQAMFPALAANIIDSSSGKLWEPVRPYSIVEIGRAKVAILGLGYPQTPGISKPQNVAGLEFGGAVETVRHYLPEIEEQADVIVVLSHAGYDQDVALAKAVDGIDVIIGGHSHKFIEWPQKAAGTIIAQAGAKGQSLGRLKLTVDLETGEVIDYDRQEALLQVTDGTAPVNQEVKALVDEALAASADTIDQPIGESATTLEPQRSGEFALGNLVTDAMLAADIDGVQADIAMHNNGGIRAGLPKGPITYGQIYAVLPFDNQLMAMDLTGAQVLEILEHSVADRAGAMQMAGLYFQFRMSSPVGQRVDEVTIGGAPLDPNKSYRIVTIDYLASGGDGYDTFLDGHNISYGDTEAWVVAEYIGVHSPVRPKIEGRIVQR